MIGVGNSDSVENQNSRSIPSYVVGVGASAGGLEALEVFFQAMPTDTGMAFVVVQHLSPDFKSLMSELLGQHTSMPIFRVEDGIEVAANSVYLIPPKKEMIITGGRLLLKDKELSQGLNLPIDQFFRSLAQDCGDRAVAVILSGTGSDGSRGIRDIHAVGGMVLAQSEDSAKFDGMPKSAIDTGIVDLVLPPQEMPAALERHLLHTNRSLQAGLVAEGSSEDRGMNAILALLRREYGIDFSHYKPNTVIRRTERRLSMSNVEDLEGYVDRLRTDPNELNLLYRDLLIGVTCFFRDADAFARLESRALTKLVQAANEDEEFRVWIAGCATGEEAYTVAMIIDELRQQFRPSLPVKIFATDVHRNSLDFASAGVYPAESLGAISEERRDRYFERAGSGFVVSPELRKMIVYAPHNIIRDAPFTKLDLITCRNLLIYLQPSAQRKALSLFHFGLKTGGIMMLGPSESPIELAEEFDCLDEQWRIFRKRRDIRLAANIRMPLQNHLAYERSSSVPVSNRFSSNSDHALLAAYEGVLNEFVPPSLLINERRELLYVFGGAETYLMPKGGRASSDVLDQFDNELRIALAGAMQRVAKQQLPVTLRGFQAAARDGFRKVDISVRPIHNRQSNAWYSLIVFGEAASAKQNEVSIPDLQVKELSLDRIQGLENDLRFTKENLQATIEELETSNEELQATNEELIASNEELQSTNEELHSVNEELYTVNAEYQRKIKELTELTSDMENLLASTQIGTIFLDQDLCIRKFTPQIGRLFDLVPHDIGRRVDAFAHNLNTNLLDEVRTVISDGTAIEKEVCDRSGNWFLLRILQYRTKDGVCGAVLTLIDVSALKRTEASLSETDRLLRAILYNSRTSIFVKDLQGKYLLANHHCTQILGVCDSTAIGKTDYDFFAADVATRMRANDLLVARTNTVHEFEEAIPTVDKGWRTFLSVKFPIHDEQGSTIAIGAIAADISRQKESEHQQREKVRARDHFLAMLSHELRNPLSAITNASQVLSRVRAEPTADHLLSVIDRQSRHISRLLDDLLDVSRLTQGKLQLQNSVFDVRDIVREAIEAMEGTISEHAHRLTVSLGDAPIFIEGDSARIQQVIVNLLANSAKYTPRGKGSLAIQLNRDATHAIITVRDNGIGIAPDQIDSIFELFAQNEQTIDRSEGGIGVGLTLVKSIVELHAGTVTAQSDGVGCGSRFEVRLPLSKEPVNPASIGSSDEIATSELSDGGLPLRILVVEDQDEGREMVRMLLELDGHVVTTAADANEALEKILRDPPNLALVDLGLPGINGFELVRQIRSHRALDTVFLVANTGYGQPSDFQDTANAGFDAHLVKPLMPGRLDQIIQVARSRIDKPPFSISDDGNPGQVSSRSPNREVGDRAADAS